MTEQAQNPTLTRRMKWIIQKMKAHSAIIQEHRDAFMEVSRWELEWEEPNPDSVSGKRFMAAEVTERMRCKLIEAKLIWCAENNPVYTKGGKFVTSEAVYALIPEDCMKCGEKAPPLKKSGKRWLCEVCWSEQ